MTALMLYQYLVRFTTFLLGLGTIWFAVFFILTWVLDYEPVRFMGLPRSRSEYIACIMFAVMLGLLGIGYAMSMKVSGSLTTLLVIVGCVEILIALLYVSFIRTTVIELRQAIRMRR